MTATDSIVVDADQATVFDVLCDPDAYVTWVVGASRVRRVDKEWPAVGSRFHHSVGSGPFKLHDSTEMRACERPYLVRLRVMARPLFEGNVEFTLESVGETRTRVVMSEEPAGGLALAAGRLNTPLLALRNRLALRRLSRLVAATGAR